MQRVAVIGAGVMGLATAYYLTRAGHRVTVYETDSVPGGMAAHFDFDGLSIERYYHFVCKSDQALFRLLGELGLADRLKWRDTRMGFYYQGALHPWGDPLALLRFPGLKLHSKLRYGIHAWLSTQRQDWSALDRISADRWLRDWLGEQAYRVCWEPLFRLKFFEYQNRISAAWIWTRIKRVGSSRRNAFKEQLGYLEGGSETLIGRLVERVEAAGGEVLSSRPVRKIALADGEVRGVVLDKGFKPFDAVISTVAIPYAVELLSDLPEAMLNRYRALPNIGVVCVVHKLKRAVTPYFWVNINDPRFEIPGIVEFSHLRPLGEDHVVYIPYYMPQTHPKFSWPNESFLEETRRYLKYLNPKLEDSDFLSAKIGRLRYAQPICGPGFLEALPPLSPGIRGLQVADTSYYYPEDRGVSEGIRLAAILAGGV